jgi:hypothetical protein
MQPMTWRAEVRPNRVIQNDIDTADAHVTRPLRCVHRISQIKTDVSRFGDALKRVRFPAQP